MSLTRKNSRPSRGHQPKELISTLSFGKEQVGEIKVNELLCELVVGHLYKDDQVGIELGEVHVLVLC